MGNLQTTTGETAKVDRRLLDAVFSGDIALVEQFLDQGVSIEIS